MMRSVIAKSKEVDEASGDDQLQAIKNQFIEGSGRIAISLLGILNKVCGQIYALLYLSPEPLSLDDIVNELKVSKGNVSINIRILEDYKLVRKVWVKGSRKDYYEAIDALPKAVLKEFFDKIRRTIHDSLDMITDCHDMAAATHALEEVQGEEMDFVLKRLELVKSFYSAANGLFEALYSGQSIDTSLLKPILNDS